MNQYVIDIETDGFKPTVIHVLSIHNLETGDTKSFTDYNAMKLFLNRKELTLIGHNIIRYDIVALEKILDIKIKARLIDTLPLSWYLEFDRVKHGLEHWGKDLGILKPIVRDWKGQPLSVYIKRCEEDVKINTKLWKRLEKKLITLYGTREEADKLIDYLSFKMHCAMLQEESKWKLDIDLATSKLEELEKEKEEKVRVLKEAMPPVPQTVKRTRPKIMYKKNGDITTYGTEWLRLLKENGLSEDYNQPIEVRVGEKEPNPNSHSQIKDWLFSLGWKPETFKYVPDGDGERAIPQVSPPKEEGVCKSVKKLYSKEPRVEVLDGLSILSHRISILKGFLENQEDGYVIAKIQGLTNTLRFTHAVCVNLPGVDKPYGEYIRGCLTAPEGYELCGSDMQSLEDRTKQHYMWKFDKAYVKEMMKPEFDAHLDLAMHSGIVTEDEKDFFAWVKKEYPDEV